MLSGDVNWVLGIGFCYFRIQHFLAGICAGILLLQTETAMCLRFLISGLGELVTAL